MTTIEIYTYTEYISSSETYIADFVRYIKMLLSSINRNYSHNLIESINLINFDGSCNEFLNNFKNSIHESINITMNIHTLLTYIAKNINTLFKPTTREEYKVYLNVISDLDKYSLLLNYICYILYVQNTQESLIYFMKLLEYGQIFDTISKVISEEITAFKFYQKITNNIVIYNNILLRSNIIPNFISEKNFLFCELFIFSFFNKFKLYFLIKQNFIKDLKKFF